MLTSALLIGTAVGLILGIAVMLVVDTPVRPDLAIALVVGVPSVIGMALIVFSGRRWMTTAGAFVLAIAPGWLGILVAIQAVHGA